MTPFNSILSGPLLQERPSRAPGPGRLGRPLIVGCWCNGRRRPLDANRDDPGLFRRAFHVGTQRDKPGDAERDGYDRAAEPTQKPAPPRDCIRPMLRHARVGYELASRVAAQPRVPALPLPDSGWRSIGLMQSLGGCRRSLIWPARLVFLTRSVTEGTDAFYSRIRVIDAP